MSRCVTLTLSSVLLGFAAIGGRTPLDSQERILVVEPAAPLEVPADAERFRMSGTIDNNQPLSAGAAGFPVDACSELGSAYTSGSLGEVRSQLTSEGEFGGTHFREAAVFIEACIFAPPPTIVALLTVTVGDGDVLRLRIRAAQVADGPPPPDSEAMGGGVVVGGTGRFAGASGQFNLSAKSHGTVLPGTNVSTQRDIDINGYIHFPAANQE
jgi:hypothetical protein